MTIRLGHHRDCRGAPECLALSEEMDVLFASGRYDYPASILEFHESPESLEFHEYLESHRTARKRAARAKRFGYSFAEIERANYADDIYEINTSKAERQGRPMSAGYLERPTFSPLPEYPCPRHRIDTYGVLKGEKLVAYLVLYLSGDMAMVSQILGHGDYMDDGIMFLLVVEALRRAPKPLTVFYNRHDSGEGGLRWFKERLGFQPERVEWAA